MSAGKLEEIKKKREEHRQHVKLYYAPSPYRLTDEEWDWLIARVEEIQAQNERLVAEALAKHCGVSTEDFLKHAGLDETEKLKARVEELEKSIERFKNELGWTL